jgi:hypothetical protein
MLQYGAVKHNNNNKKLDDNDDDDYGGDKNNDNIQQQHNNIQFRQPDPRFVLGRVRQLGQIYEELVN